MLRFILAVAFGWTCSQALILAQTTPFVGVLGGVATLSADARSLSTPQGLNVSLYKPENGRALNIAGGVHLDQYLSLQASYVWNRNSLTLSSGSSGSASFYEQRRKSSQQAILLDLLVYFRRQDDRLRPYLSAGTEVVHF